MNHFALTDAAGIGAAFLLFTLLGFSPGFLVGHLFNLWQFQARTFAFQLPASVALSIGASPILTFLLGSIGGWRLVWAVYLCSSLAGCYLLVRSRPRLDKTVRMALAIGLVWSMFAAVWLMDWQFASRVYVPTYASDYSTRAAIVHSLAAFGLPAQSPFFYPGHPVALHYHFFWLLQCATVHALAPVLITARTAFIAGAIWSGLGLISLAVLTMRILVKRRSWIVVGLLAVTGLDIIPALLILLGNRLHAFSTLPPSVEWWNEQVDGWVYSVLWEPHYVCALIACVTGFLIVWQSNRVAPAFVAALCFATAAGSGSFVALVFAAFLVIWMIFNLGESRLLALAGTTAAILSLPYIATLRSPAQNVGGPALFKFTIRSFLPLHLPALVDLLALPLNYFFELGFFGVCAWVGYRRKLVRHEWMLAIMAATSIVICTFVKSEATPNNDLGWRGFLVAQFALLVLSAAYLEHNRPSRVLKVLLCVGLLGTAYDLILTRFYPILSDLNQVPKLKWLASDSRLGERTRANREAYQWLQLHSVPTAFIGQNPDVDAVDLFSGLYADRSILAGDRTCTVGFGGASSECAPLEADLSKLFTGKGEISQACLLLPARLYIVKDTDPIWNQPRSWAFSKTPVFANQFVRIFECARSNSLAK